mgnify:CR=1 FL=1
MSKVIPKAYCNLHNGTSIASIVDLCQTKAHDSAAAVLKLMLPGKLIDRLSAWYYRAATFFVLSILDDPAVLAMAFC